MDDAGQWQSGEGGMETGWDHIIVKGEELGTGILGWYRLAWFTESNEEKMTEKGGEKCVCVSVCRVVGGIMFLFPK